MAEEDNNIGRLVAGRYRLDELLGRGGFGSVYRGWDSQIGRDVAVKLLDVTDGTRSEQQTAALRERFRREAMAAGRINHHGVVTIYDFGLAEEGEAYLVMELLEGHDLAHELRENGPMLPDRAKRLFIPMLEALGRGHELGIVHKDIKPQNIFLCHPRTNSEAFCLVDFGVARVVHEDKLTMTGLIVGTPQYMAPEYITDTLVTPALDVYQMGLILAELITGSPAVPADESFVKSCNRHFTGDLEIPDELLEGDFGRMLQMALRPIPKERLPTAKRFAEMFAEIDPSTIVLDTQSTMLFKRKVAKTLTEPPMFPPMKPEQVSAELERLEEGSDAYGAAPHTPVSVVQPSSDAIEDAPLSVHEPVARNAPTADDEGRAVDSSVSEAELAPDSEAGLVSDSEAAEGEPKPPDVEPVLAPTATPGSVVATPPIATSPPIADSEQPPVAKPPAETATGPAVVNSTFLYAGASAIFIVGMLIGIVMLLRDTPSERPAEQTTSMPADPVPEIEVETPTMTTISSEPSGASIVLDGQVIGRTPKSIDVARADAVELHLDGYEVALVALEPNVETIPLTKIGDEADSPTRADPGISQEKSSRKLIAGQPFVPEEPDDTGTDEQKPSKFEPTHKKTDPKPWKKKPIDIAQ